MEKENSSHKNVLDSIPESRLSKMSDDLDWLGSIIGIEIKEGDYLIKSEKELFDGEDLRFRTCEIEGELNGKGLRISKMDVFSEKTGEFNRAFYLSERVESEEQENERYELVCKAEKKESMEREDLLSRYKRKKIEQYHTPYDRQMQLFYEELSQERDYKELKTLHEALEKVAITVNEDEN